MLAFTFQSWYGYLIWVLAWLIGLLAVLFMLFGIYCVFSDDFDEEIERARHEAQPSDAQLNYLHQATELVEEKLGAASDRQEIERLVLLREGLHGFLKSYTVDPDMQAT